MHHRRTRLLLAVPAAALALTTLVGCGEAVEKAIENEIEDAAASDGVDVDIDLDNPSDISIEGTDGGVVTGKLPSSFPTDEVEVIDGDILVGGFTKNPETWNVTIEVGPAGGDKQAAYDEAADDLTGGGATVTTEALDNGASISGTFTTATYLVNLAVTDSNGIVVNYTVTPK